MNGPCFAFCLEYCNIIQKLIPLTHTSKADYLRIQDITGVKCSPGRSVRLLNLLHLLIADLPRIRQELHLFLSAENVQRIIDIRNCVSDTHWIWNIIAGALVCLEVNMKQIGLAFLLSTEEHSIVLNDTTLRAYRGWQTCASIRILPNKDVAFITRWSSHTFHSLHERGTFINTGRVHHIMPDEDSRVSALCSKRPHLRANDYRLPWNLIASAEATVVTATRRPIVRQTVVSPFLKTWSLRSLLQIFARPARICRRSLSGDIISTVSSAFQMQSRMISDRFRFVLHTRD